MSDFDTDQRITLYLNHPNKDLIYGSDRTSRTFSRTIVRGLAAMEVG